MLVSMVNTSGLVNNTQNCETCFKAGFTVFDFNFKVILSIHGFQRIQPSNLTFRFLIDHALRIVLSKEEKYYTDANVQLKKVSIWKSMNNE